MVGEAEISHRRRGQGQNWHRKGTTVSQDNRKGPCRTVSPRDSHWLHTRQRLAQERKRGLGTVQAAKPAAQRGGIGYPIGVLDGGRCRFPAAALHKTPAQRLTSSQQAVVGVRKGEAGKERKRFPAIVTETATDLNPVMLPIMGLLAAATVADDRVLLTNWAPPQDDPGASLRPIRFEVVLRGGKWDKEYRGKSGVPPGQDQPRSRPKWSP